MCGAINDARHFGLHMIWEGNMKLFHRRQFAVGAAALTAIACVGFVITTSTQAQEFPSKNNITLMMPYAAGGPGDTLTRIIGQGMGKALVDKSWWRTSPEPVAQSARQRLRRPRLMATRCW